MSKKDKNVKSADEPMTSSATVAPVNDGRPKRDIIKEAIEKGGATRESLMQVAGVNKAGLASQLSYLNLIAKGAGTGFPLEDENKVFYLGTKEEYEAKNANRGTGGKAATPKTPEQILEAARKREDRASSKLTNAKKKAEDNPTEENKLRYQIAELELRLASILLGKVEQGDYSSENASVVEGTPAGLDSDGDGVTNDAEML